MANTCFCHVGLVSEQYALQRLDVIEHGAPVRVPPWVFLVFNQDHFEHASTHVLYFKYCQICRAWRLHNQQCRRQLHEGKFAKLDEFPTLNSWLDTITADHAKCGAYENARMGHACVVVAQDRHATWRGGFRMQANDSTVHSLLAKTFCGSSVLFWRVYIDEPGECVVAVKDLGWPVVHGISTCLPSTDNCHRSTSRDTK